MPCAPVLCWLYYIPMHTNKTIIHIQGHANLDTPQILLAVPRIPMHTFHTNTHARTHINRAMHTSVPRKAAVPVPAAAALAQRLCRSMGYIKRIPF